MSAVARAYTFTDGADAYGSQVEAEFNTIYNAWNNHNSGVSTWTSLKVTTLTLSGSGNGITLTTPDGLHTYTIAIDNSGVIGSTQLT